MHLGERDACGVGFVAHIKGQRTRAIVDQGLEVLRRLSHRAACGADPDTGDGAGILMQLPERFFRLEGARLGFDLPANRRFAIGNIFLPPDPGLRAACEGLLESAIRDEGQAVIGWRDVPINLPETFKEETRELRNKVCYIASTDDMKSGLIRASPIRGSNRASTKSCCRC